MIYQTTNLKQLLNNNSVQKEPPLQWKG